MQILCQCSRGHQWTVTHWSAHAMQCPTCGRTNEGRSSLEMAKLDRAKKEADKLEARRHRDRVKSRKSATPITP